MTSGLQASSASASQASELLTPKPPETTFHTGSREQKLSLHASTESPSPTAPDSPRAAFLIVLVISLSLLQAVSCAQGHLLSPAISQILVCLGFLPADQSCVSILEDVTFSFLPHSFSGFCLCRGDCSPNYLGYLKFHMNKFFLFHKTILLPLNKHPTMC